MLTLLVVLTSASPVATGLEISSTGSLPPHERSHRNRSHALHRAQRRHPRHGFSCGPTFFQLRSPAQGQKSPHPPPAFRGGPPFSHLPPPAATAQVSALSDVQDAWPSTASRQFTTVDFPGQPLAKSWASTSAGNSWEITA